MAYQINKTKISLVAVALGLIVAFLQSPSLAEEQPSQDLHVVFSVYRPVDLGDGVTPPKDIFVSIGKKDGVRNGTSLEVLRRIPTYDLSAEKLHGEMIFPFAKLKIIHADQISSIARVENIYPTSSAPSVAPRSIQIGDIVRPIR